jgi:hypothetical protein
VDRRFRDLLGRSLDDLGHLLHGSPGFANVALRLALLVPDLVLQRVQLLGQVFGLPNDDRELTVNDAQVS